MRSDKTLVTFLECFCCFPISIKLNWRILMAFASRSISGTVHVASDSGSPERVAWEICWAITHSEKIVVDGNYRHKLLDLYAECLTATRGFRDVG